MISLVTSTGFRQKNAVKKIQLQRPAALTSHSTVNSPIGNNSGIETLQLIPEYV